MSEKNVHIKVNHVTRVEGHGNIVVDINNGSIEKCEWQVPEAPRFFEAMVVGRHYSEVARITSRICGICSIGHTIASVKATEDALGIEVSKQTKLLRRITKLGETFDSHILHIYFLIAPDLLNVQSVFPLVETHKEVVTRALRLKKLGSQWAGLISGRSTHPTKIIPGGLSALPKESDLAQLKKSILESLPDVEETAKLLLDLVPNLPEFNRETEYVGLVDDYEYGFYDGKIGSILPNGDRDSIELNEYKSVANEWVSPLSTAKYTKHKMESYMVGALARININFEMLHPKAKEMAMKLNFTLPCYNPYFNSVAQFIECVHSAYTTVDYIDQLLESGIKQENLVLPTKFGKGVGAADVPRGILFHEYIYDKEGFCTMGNCIIPTNQNHANIQLDMEKLVPEMLKDDLTEKQMELKLEMLVRSYDPCISCSTHYLKVKFKK